MMFYLSDVRWFPADEALSASSYGNLLPPLVNEIFESNHHRYAFLKSKNTNNSRHFSAL